MSIFYLSTFSGLEAVEKALKDSSLPHVEASQGQWFVSFKGTSQELSDLIGISDSKNGQTGIVVAVSGYWGLASNNVWEFIAAHWND